jgi:RNA-directed DNA polymerase
MHYKMGWSARLAAACWLGVMHAKEWVARNLAAALLAGVWTPRALLGRAESVLGRRTRKSQRALVEELIGSAPAAYPPSPPWLLAFFLKSRRFEQASAPKVRDPQSVHPVLKSAKFAPADRFAHLDVPRLAAPGDLAKWLQISIDQLDWLSDAKRQHAMTDIPILHHYRYAFASKKSGPPRLIEIPKPKLMPIQRRILHEILDTVPTHNCVHGFVKSRSCLSAAQVHAGETIVVTVDLKNFFLNTPLSRAHGIFRSLGYPWAVARHLTGLCSPPT